jgi:TonB family protein
MKYLYMILLLMMLGCPARRDVLVPVLLDYDLYYPDEARRQGIEGTVHVRVLVNRSGKPEDVVITKSSGRYLLDSAAVRTAKTFVFSPAMLSEKAQKTWVLVPIEFKFMDIDYEEWLAEVEITQRRISKRYDKDAVDELYDLYKQMIFSPWEANDISFNEYIRLVVVDRTAQVWEDYWFVYPARVVLFVDIINRYPESFTALKARADLSNFLDKEKIVMRQALGSVQTDTLVNRIMKSIEFQ